MPSFCAVACAVGRLREAIAAISQCAPRCIAGSTLATPMLAVLNTPQRTLLIAFSVTSYRETAQCWREPSAERYFFFLLLAVVSLRRARRNETTANQWCEVPLPP